ncbi:ComEA family DNA-binding protein [Streptomyces coffeae]|uniref:Helix-hairpin-helix domain-containing protein n=1 Tax=Streptomyces coffeae TaxID=621382 RepID=A0ABS1NLY1_9ACTN|nr:helix-hairpin-helix domain-containing protein [Streptomyces coffeae]MBL1101056.1 helix-hairpin-helix domain-containing protein [Streptomyces coffeae]
MVTRININTADERQLQELPGIGPGLARRIVAYRADVGYFRTVEELAAVAGVTDEIVADLKKHAVVGPGPSAGDTQGGFPLEVRLSAAGGAGADFTGYAIRGLSERKEAGPGGDVLFVPFAVAASADAQGRATLMLPPKEDLGPRLTAVVTTPDGRVLHRDSVETAGLDGVLTLSVRPVSYETPARTSDPSFGRPPRVRGRVVDAKGTSETGRRLVVLWGSTEEQPADGDLTPLLAVETDLTGYFSGPYPLGAFERAQGTVALGDGQIATVPIHLGEDGTFPERVLLVVDLPAATDGGDHGCTGSPDLPRNPDARDLATAEGTFAADPGGGRCTDFTRPDRTLEEYSFSYAVRTTEPEIRGLTLEDEPTVPVGTLLAAFPAHLPFGQAREIPALEAGDGGHEGNPTAVSTGLAERAVSAKLAKTLLADPNTMPLTRIEATIKLSAHAELLKLLGRVTPAPSERTELTGDTAVDWDDDPTIYQAVTVAHGHLLRFKQEWVADGYSMGDLLYSLPLAPAQRKMIAIVDWERRESAAREEFTTAAEQLSASLTRDRDVTDIVNATLSEEARGGSHADTGAIGGGFGIPLLGGLLGIGGGTSSANSSSWETASRTTTAYALNQLRDRTLQGASAVRSQRSSVVQTVTQGERTVAETEVVANYNHCHTLTVQYFQVLRHLLVRQRLSDVQECLFVPLLISRFTPDKVLRWGETLRPELPRHLQGGIDALSRINAGYAGSDLPVGAYADDAITSVDGELYLRFQLARPKDENDEYHEVNWGGLAALLGIDTQEFYQTFLRGQAQKDRVFLEQLGPRIAQRFVEHLQFFAVREDNSEARLPIDITLLTTFANDRPLYVSLRMGAASLPPLVRRDIKQIRISGLSGLLGVLLGTILPAGSRVIVDSGTMRYRTAHIDHALFQDAMIRNDLAGGADDGVRISTRLSGRELRNPRNEDLELSRMLLEHLNEGIERYHHLIWAKMSPNRRYLLLDGFEAPNAGGKSIASVVDNELIGIVGNCLVMPVSRGYHLDPTFDATTVNGDRVDLIEHYQPETPIEPMRIAIPTKGVYAEAVQGACNSCEFKEEERFWRWEEAPVPDALPTIQPVSTESRRAEPPGLEAKDLPAPIIAMQNAPAAPDPTGLAQVLALLGRPDLFRDMAGLAGTQQNAAAALQAAMSAAQFFGGKAGDLAMQGQMARDIDKAMRTIRNSRAANLIDDAQAGELTESAIRGLIGERRPSKEKKLTEEPEVRDLIRSQTGVESSETRVSRDGERVEVRRPATNGAGPLGAGARPPVLPGAGSTRAEALAAIEAFRGRTVTGPWRLDRGEVADRLAVLVNDPDTVHQDALNLCGPAAFVRLWLQRDPLAVVRFAAELFDSGEARIGGDYAVEPDDDSLLGQDYAALRAAAGPDFCPSADWMILGSLRDAENAFFDFEGRPDEDVSAATTSGEVADWLHATGLYREVSDEGNFFFTKGIDHLLDLSPSTNQDVALLINAHILAQADVIHGDNKSDEFILNAFPNHFIVLTARVQPVPGDLLQMTYWTWGLPVTTAKFERATVDANYYGAVIANR